MVAAVYSTQELETKMRISQPLLEWHDLPQDLLEEVFYYLKDQENLQCRQVCALWRSVAVEAYQKHIPLLLNLKSGDGEDSSSLLNISTQEKRRIDLSGYFRNHRRLCNTTNRNRPHVVYLLNPLTRIEILLPFPDTPTAVRVLKKKSARSHHQDFLVLAVYDDDSYIVQDFKNWRPIDPRSEEVKFSTNPIVSCMFYKEELYAADEEGNILCFKINCRRNADLVFLTEGPVKRDSRLKYLVESLSGSFLLVCRDELWEYLEDVYDIEPSMEVYTLCLKTNEWSKVSNLGEQALFLSSGGSKAVHTGAISGHWLRSNCIYFDSDAKHACLYDLETKRPETLQRCSFWDSQLHWIIPDL